ncbi:MAG TPA: hypothetical protein VF615_08595 [Longimicrobiaceae bacterium]|jgi:hypothetical protein
MSSPSHARAPGLRDQVLRECAEMVRYALSSGKRVPASLVGAVETALAAPAAGASDLPALAAAHERLAKLVAPATPQALVLFADEESKQRGMLRLPGPVRLVRRMSLAALVSVTLFIASSLSPRVSHTSGDVLDSFGWDLLANEVFWLASAGVGASFAMLFQVNEFIVDRSYDPKYESSYWIKFLIGVIAGFILVALIPLDGLEGAAAGSEAAAKAQALARPTIAMLGGFSASAVYRILNRLMSTVEGLFRADPREEAALREQAAGARAAEEAAATRLGTASRLVELRQQLAAGASPEEVSRLLAEMVSAMVPGEGGAPAPPNGTPPAADATEPADPASDPAEAAPTPGKVAVPALVGAPDASS